MKKSNSGRLKVMSLMLVLLIFVICSAFIQDKGKNDLWIKNSTLAQIEHVNVIRNHLESIDPRDFLVYKDGSLGYVTQIDSVVRFKKIIGGIRCFISSNSSNQDLYKIERIVKVREADYNQLSGKFLQEY